MKIKAIDILLVIEILALIAMVIIIEVYGG